MADILKNEKYNVLDSIVEKVHEDCVRIDSKEKKYLVERFQKVISTFTEQMKASDPTFKQIFCRIGYTGSFFDGVRVGEATEFDLNLVLKPKLKMEPVKKDCERGFVKIKIVSAGDHQKPDWIVNGFLLPSRVRRWLEGVVDKANKSLSGKVDDCQVKVAKSGPAITLKVTSNVSPKKEISIDLVPVIEFPGIMWPPIPEKPKKLLNGGYGQPWFAVPKAEEAWRMSFPSHEKFICKDLKYFKYTLRLMKKVRDDLGIQKVASYYIKTLFLWEIECTTDPQAMWSTNRRGPLFMHMLVRFREALQEEKIPFFWDKEQNLIAYLKGGYLKHSYDLLNNFIKQIDKYINDKKYSDLDDYICKILKHSKAPKDIKASAPAPEVSLSVQPQPDAQQWNCVVHGGQEVATAREDNTDVGGSAATHSCSPNLTICCSDVNNFFVELQNDVRQIKDSVREMTISSNSQLELLRSVFLDQKLEMITLRQIVMDLVTEIRALHSQTFEEKEK